MRLEANFKNKANIFYLEHYRAVRVEWMNLFMTLEEWLEIIHTTINISKGRSINVWIADLYNSDRLFSKEVINYWVEEGMDLVKESGFEYVLTVNPKTVGITTMSDRQWKKPVSDKKPFVLEQFDTLDAATKWLDLKNEYEKSGV